MICKMQKIAAVIAICCVCSVLPSFGQNANVGASAYANLVMKEYGLDHELINGVQFYNRYSRSKGFPYFLQDQYLYGSLTLEGRIYQDVRLKFDIYSQHVELEYKNYSGANNRIITVAEKVDEFSYGEFHFKKLELEQGEKKFYQVIKSTCFTCYIYWDKDLLPLNGSFTYIEQFSEAKRTLWLDLSGELHEFTSRKDFSELFPEQNRKEIKRYLSKAQFQFRTASVYEIVRTLEAVCNLLEEKGNI